MASPIHSTFLSFDSIADSSWPRICVRPRNEVPSPSNDRAPPARGCRGGINIRAKPTVCVMMTCGERTCDSLEYGNATL
ncbi:hypothetical protein I7I53_09328 [Histoplasma capsulatum var. duboisii H88]|uniref:Uncharacterized protein n=1 Tax=Ajellomyces capsulatus (strain H88) TaxID=544711 RepID=A0A8A1L4Q2_AJEC8|nr:hypothetical protein I7I53_09328 [Histoplasma capsulatum var. duboisii H88]